MSDNQVGTQEPRFWFDLGGTTYPRDRNRLPTGRGQRRVVERPARREFHKRLENTLWSRMAFDRTAQEGFTDHDHLHRVAAEDYRLLSAATDDVVHLIETLCHVNTEFSAVGEVNEEARDQAITQVKAKVLDRVAVNLRPRGSVWEHRLDQVELDEAAEEVRGKLESTIRDFADQFVELLDELVSISRLGLVTWEPPGNCDILFYRDIVVQQDTDVTTIRSHKGSEVIHSSNLRTITRRTIEVRNQFATKHEVSEALYYMKLRKAKAEQIDRTPALVPRTIQPLLDALPSWLRPLVELIDGERYFLRVIRRRVADVDIEQEGRHEEIELIHEDPMAHYDPAIALDRYVLTGWGPEETEVEEKSRAAEQKEHTAIADAAAASVRFWPAALVVCLLVVAGAALAGFGNSWRPAYLLGYVVASVGAVGSLVPLRLERMARRRKAPWPYLLAGAAAVIAGSSCLLFLVPAVRLGSLPVGAMAFLAGIVSVVAAIAARKLIR